MEDEYKEVREKIIKELDEDNPDWRDFQPGTYGCHEALHTVSIIERLIDRELLNYPAIVLNEQWFKKVYEAATLMADLYQEIGGEHLSVKPS